LNKQQSLELFLILLGLFCCVARAETQPTPQAEGGSLEGSISLHTISGGPVRQGVPDSRPLANTTFVVKKADLTVASFTTDDQGRFRISLPPGHYSTLDKLWEAHRVRNNLVHTPDFNIPQAKAEEVVGDYEAFLKEVKAL